MVEQIGKYKSLNCIEFGLNFSLVRDKFFENIRLTIGFSKTSGRLFAILYRKQSLAFDESSLNLYLTSPMRSYNSN